MNTIAYPESLDFLTHARPGAQPLFLRTIAPNEPGAVASYQLTLLQQPIDYAVHWGRRPDGGTDRHRCLADDCPWCVDGNQPQEMYAGLVIDHAVPRFAIVQASRAASKQIATAAMTYLDDLRSAEPVAKVGVFGLSDPRQPIIELRAKRTAVGPRYKATAKARLSTTNPMNGEPLSLAIWFLTDDGKAWLDEALGNTSQAVRSHVLRPHAFDPLPLIFPEEYAAPELWDDDVDE